MRNLYTTLLFVIIGFSAQAQELLSLVARPLRDAVHGRGRGALPRERPAVRRVLVEARAHTIK